MEDVAAELADSSDSARERSRSRNGRHDESIKSLEELVAELDAMTGLSSVKQEVGRLISQVKVAQRRREAGLQGNFTPPHMLFMGNPGTGKTTVARIVSQILAHLGVLGTGSVVEASRSTLVAGYSGQTATKTWKVVNSALGGVLFIDEAYALARGELAGSSDSFGFEAVDTLLKAMEDHRGDLVVIAAGYPGPMQVFLDANPGAFSKLPFSLVTSPTR